MPRCLSAVCLGLVILVNTGCSDPVKTSGTPTVAVKGTVDLDGKPMPTGEIWFTIPGEPPSIVTIAEGKYAGKAHEGKNRVEVYAYKEGPPLSTDPGGAPTKVNTIATKYNGPESTLKADVTAGGANEFKFEVTSQ